MGIAFNSDSKTTVSAPNDIVMGIINNLIGLKKKALKDALSIHYTNFVELFLDYQSFLEENMISTSIARLHLIEQFFLESKVMTIPISELSYSLSLLWSKYFSAIFLYSSSNEIRFFTGPLPNLLGANYNETAVKMVKEYVDILQNKSYARWSHEIISRCNYIINYTGNKIDPSIQKLTFVGLDVSN
jgi:hypothetical protein